MNPWIDKLNRISGKTSRLVLGVMSGTSMDGIDLALCKVEGASSHTHLEVIKSETVKIPVDVNKKFSELAYKPEIAAGEILGFEALLSRQWIRLISNQIGFWDVHHSDLDLIASHGQTILHRPDSDGELHNTWQLVDGDQLAQKLGVITVSDFRQKHIAAGYEGAPLAPLAELLLFQESNENRILLNVGGIANFTFLKKNQDELAVPFATDTGPANTLMDASAKRLMPGHEYDHNGDTARTGNINQNLLHKLMEHPFFKRPFPKSTGQEEFNWQWLHETMLKVSPNINIADLLATLSEFTAITIADAISSNVPFEQGITKVYVSGGGWNNHFLMERLKSKLTECEIRSSTDLGLKPEVKEAALFAVLGNETVAGEGWINEDGMRFTLGKISLP
jgi:anhydro-N-acetylmuramic acid kinase